MPHATVKLDWTLFAGNAAVSMWKTTSRLDKGSNKDGQPTFNCLLLQFGVVAQGVQELLDLMREVEHQPASTILQVFSSFC